MSPADPPPDTPGGPVVHVPDDARDLQRDVRALYRERRAARRRQRLRGLVLTRRWDRFGLSGPIVIAVLLAVGLYGALPILLRPASDSRRSSSPLATPTVAPGTLGGLLPDGPLLTPGGRTRTQELARPTALVLVPLPCDCEAVLASIVPQVIGRAGIRVVTQGLADPTGESSRALRSGQGRGQIDAAVDLDGVLARAYAPVGVTLVLVAPDGVVVGVVRDVHADQKLDVDLSALDR